MIRAKLTSGLLLLVVLLTYTPLSAQPYTHVKTIHLKGVERVSIDRVGFFYTVQSNGTIKKFSEDTELVAEYNQASTDTPDIIEAWSGMRVISFNRDKQNYTLFDRFLRPLGSYTIDQALSIDSYLCTISGDNSIWVFDQSDYSLKKINTQLQSVEVEVFIDRKQFKAGHNFNFIRDYQNMLFLNDPGIGILIFNNIGKQLRTLEFKGLEYFNFLGMDLYYVKDKQLHLHDLYTGDHETIELPLAPRFALLTDETMLLVDEQAIHFYRIDLTGN